ncbi:MAG: hypothetical protein GKR98_07890 [Boseongicola sp.]|nr:MAG: hypothetical protein GKR98_07890 [Boseongicola sp.]
MPAPTKIATCCYCGTRAALVLTGKTRHELACSNCGAPLHELKMLRVETRGDRELVPPSRIRKKSRKTKGHRAPKKQKRRQSGLGDYFMSRAAEAADDILDDILDIFD